MPEDDGLNATDVPTIDIEGLEESVFELARQRCGAPSRVSNASRLQRPQQVRQDVA